MRYIWIKLIMLSATWISSCQAESEPPPPTEETYYTTAIDLVLFTWLPDDYLCTATKEVPGLGTVSWTANTRAWISDNNMLNINFMTYTDTVYQYQREHIGIQYIPIRLGDHTVYDDHKNRTTTVGIYARLLADGDVSDAAWRPDLSKNNYVRLTKIDLENRQLEGEFDLHFKIIIQGKHGTAFSERINFKSGKFRAKIRE
jgi:hypothetical protein